MTFVRHQGGTHSVNVSAKDLPSVAAALRDARVTVRHEISAFPEFVEFAMSCGIPAPRIRIVV